MLIIVMGLPGSGKSFFAQKLAENLGMAYLNSDVIRKEIRMQGQYQPAQKWVVYEKMAEKARGFLQMKKSVIVDATFQFMESRELFKDLSGEFGQDLVCFYIWAVEPLITERLSHERQDSEADFEVYRLVKMDYAAIPSHCHSIQSTNENINDMINKAKIHLKPNQ
ncbi:MAG: ATP-binding protein [Cyclobacteriaceae bacterium]